MNRFKFSVKWRFVSLITNHVPIIKMWSNESFINSEQWKSWKNRLNLQMKPIVFEILSKTPFKCLLKFSLLSKINRRYFSDSVWLNWELLKDRLAWTGLLSFLLKITSYACLVRSGLNIISSRHAHLLVFLRASLSSLVLTAKSGTTEKSDVSPANSFALVIKSSGRSLI